MPKTNNKNMEWLNDKYRVACIMSRQSVTISKTRILNSSLENIFIDFHWWRIALNLFMAMAMATPVQSTVQRCIFFSPHSNRPCQLCWMAIRCTSQHLKLTRTHTCKHIIIYYSTNEHKLCMYVCLCVRCTMCVHKGMINKRIIAILFRQRTTLNVMCWDAFIQTLNQIKRVRACVCVSFQTDFIFLIWSAQKWQA